MVQADTPQTQMFRPCWRSASSASTAHHNLLALRMAESQWNAESHEKRLVVHGPRLSHAYWATRNLRATAEKTKRGLVSQRGNPLRRKMWACPTYHTKSASDKQIGKTIADGKGKKRGTSDAEYYAHSHKCLTPYITGVVPISAKTENNHSGRGQPYRTPRSLLL